MPVSFHTPPEHIEPIYRWYKHAQIDYVDHYIRLYIAYNAWYREVTTASSDRQSLAQLKKRVIIWDDYVNGRTMKQLKVYMERLVDLTGREPLGRTLHWSGSIDSTADWQSLIEYWYQIRCLLVHGAQVKPVYVWLAFETLDVFMGEIIDRMHAVLNDASESPKAKTLKKGKASKKYNLQHKIYEKYLSSPDIWQVDMQRVYNS